MRESSGEAGPPPYREGGRWSDIMAAPLNDYVGSDRPLVLGDSPLCSCMWCERRAGESADDGGSGS